MKHAAAILPSLLVLSLTVPATAQLGPGQDVCALGVTGEYAHGPTRDIRHDGGTMVSFRYGFYWYLLSLFFTADAGWRYADRKIVARAGGEAYFGPGFFGLHVDVFDTVKLMERRPFTVPGVTLGCATSFPSNPSFTLFFGGHAGNGEKNELVVRLTVAYNFKDRDGFITGMAKTWSHW